MELEFGTLRGLAVTNDFAAHDAQRIELLKLERQMRLDAENSAKLQADEYKRPEIMNEYDSPRAQKIAEENFKKASRYEIENRGWELSPEKRRIRDKFLYDAVNNPYTYRGMRYKEFETKLRDYIASNPGAEDDEAIQAQLNKAKEYKNWQGPGDPPELMFFSPENEDKMLASLQEAASKASQNGYEPYRDGLGSARQFVTDANKTATAKTYALSKEAKYWERQYNRIQDPNKKPYEDWLLERLEPFFPKDIITPGKFMKGVDAHGNIIASQGEQAGLMPYQETLRKALTLPYQDVQAPAEALESIYRGNDGKFDMSDSYLMHIDTGNIKNSNKLPINLGAIKNVVSSGIIKWVPDASNRSGGSFLTKFVATIPQKKAVETKTGEKGPIANDPWYNSFSLSDEYDGYGVISTVDENGEDAVQVEIWKPLDPESDAQSLRFNGAVGGGKAESVNSSMKQQNASEREYREGDTLYIQGTNTPVTLKADGNWYTPDGKIYGQ